MLLGNFFTISSIAETAGIIKAALQINAQHEIFEGHFPGQPVVPGVCMMQMVKEIMEQASGRKPGIESAADIKFLAVINPVENSAIDAEIKYAETENGNLSVQASFTSKDTIHFKCKCILHYR